MRNRGALRGAAILLCLLLVTALLGVAWLAVRPLPLPFLIPSFENALADETAGRTARINEASLTWGGLTTGLVVRLQGLSVALSGSNQSAEFGAVAIKLATTELLRGRLAARTISFASPEIHLTRAEGGELEIGLGDDTGGSSAAFVAPDLIRYLLAPDTPGQALSFLNSVAVRDADVHLRDRARGVTLGASPAALVVRREDEGLHFAMEAQLGLVSGAGSAGSSKPVPFTAEARAIPDGDDMKLEITASLEGFDVATLGAWWPRQLASDAREWVVANIPSGTADTAHVDLQLHLVEADPRQASVDSLSARVEARDLRVDYLAPLPPATGLRSVLRFGLDRFDFEIQGGSIHDVTIESGTVAITGLDAEPSISIEARTHGPLTTILQILDQPPLALFEGWDITPAEVRGRSESHLHLTFPLSDDLDFGDIVFRGDAKLHEVETDQLPLGLKGGDFEVAFTDRYLEISGPLDIGKMPASLEWREDFGGDRRIRLESMQKHEGLASLRYDPDDAGQRLRFESSDTGALVRLFEGSDRLQGGSLQIDAAQTEWGAPLHGSFELTDFSVSEGSWLLRLVEALSVHGLISAMTRQGLDLESAKGAFSWADDVLEVENVRMVGSSMAATSTGTFNLADRSLDIRGTLVPIETLSRWLGEVPVLGRIFTGGDQKGLFAADFRVRGPMADPDVDVNKLTSLTPGILRTLAQEVLPDEEADPTSR